MVSNKLTTLLYVTVAIAFLYQSICTAKIDEPTKVVTVSEQLKDPASKAPDGYKYFTMAVDPHGLYNYLYYSLKPAAPTDELIIKTTLDHAQVNPQQHAPYEGYKYLYDYQDKGKYVYIFGKTVTAPADQFIIKLTFDHEFKNPLDAQKYTPYEGWNYLYYYPEKGSFVYVYGKMNASGLYVPLSPKITDYKGNEPIDTLIEYYRACTAGKNYNKRLNFKCEIWAQTYEDLKQYYGVKTIAESYKKLNLIRTGSEGQLPSAR